MPFQTKLAQAGQMLIGIGNHFATSPLLVVTDRWFGNDGLWRPVRDVLGERFQLRSRLRCNNVLYAQSDASQPGQRRKYGKRRNFCVYDEVVMLKTLKRPVHVVILILSSGMSQRLTNVADVARPHSCLSLNK